LRAGRTVQHPLRQRLPRRPQRSQPGRHPVNGR
jgi:hypothetical protein